MRPSFASFSFWLIHFWRSFSVFTIPCFIFEISEAKPGRLYFLYCIAFFNSFFFNVRLVWKKRICALIWDLVPFLALSLCFTMPCESSSDLKLLFGLFLELNLLIHVVIYNLTDPMLWESLVIVSNQKMIFIMNWWFEWTTSTCWLNVKRK